MSYIFAYGCFAGFLIAAGAAIFVIARNPRDRLNRSFLLSAAASAVYCLLVGLFFINNDLLTGVGIHRASVSAWLVFLVAQLYFSMAIAQTEERFGNRLLLALVFVLALGLSIFDWSGYTLYQASVESPWGQRALPGLYYYYFTVFSIMVAGLQFIYFSVAWRKTRNKKEKEQVVTVMSGLAAGSFIGTLFDIVAPLGGFFSQSFGWLASTVYVSSFAYAMVRYGLMVVTPSSIAGDVVNMMPDLLVVIGLDRRISLVNRRLVERLGYLMEEIVGKKMEWLIASPKAEALCAQIETTLDQDGIISDQLTQLRNKDGRVFPVRLDAVRARDRFSNELGNILIFRDISEAQKMLEKQEEIINELTRTKERMLSILGDTTEARDEAKLKAAELAKAVEDLKVVDKMKTEFLSVISHELRTPLTSINGYTGLLLDGQVGQLSDDQKKAVEVIKREGGHLLTLINSVLDVSRLVAGKSLEIKKEPVLLKRLLEEIALAMAPQLNENRISFSVELPPDFPTIEGDPDKLSQMLTNILGNSLKYTPQAGWIKASGSLQGDQVEIRIADNGIGIAKENLEKIFEKFYQVDSSITRSTGGVGLGLSIAREIVEAHGGKIWAESEGLGWGTTIKLTLPVA
jgi:PAS domain S-box-containing protein